MIAKSFGANTKVSVHELAFYSLATTSIKEFFDCPGHIAKQGSCSSEYSCVDLRVAAPRSTSALRPCLLPPLFVLCTFRLVLICLIDVIAQP